MRRTVPVSRFFLKFGIYKTGESTRRGVVDEQKTAGLKAGGFLLVINVLPGFDVFKPAWGFHIAEIGRFPNRIYFRASRP